MDSEDILEGCLSSHLSPSKHLQVLSFCDIGHSFSISRTPVPAVYREFMKMLALVVHPLRTGGIRVHGYLDDWRANTPDPCSVHTEETIHLLQFLGWTINWKKSVLKPSRISESAFRTQSGPHFANQLIFRDTHQCPISSARVNHHVCPQDYVYQQQNFSFRPVHIPGQAAATFFPILAKTMMVSTC